ncbi:urocanate hydratase [Sulfobacillus thermosulfidooxidans]|uniref:urocanate hydratase n=1 Tax=Sulfobacillus thermosulfidooxidans TaxID=28034 RepID=UPI0006B40DB3|nr:urocanate hydratase [Sulfobacillus thermosulfidooxidans]
MDRDFFQHVGIQAPTGPTRHCKGWGQEAALRMLMNNLDARVGENPSERIVYGGRGRAARSWPAYDKIVESLLTLENDETLLIQSGKPVGIFKTQPQAPRVLIANANLVGKWATLEEFDRLEKQGLTMFGQMTAGSWIYIGSQGVIQGTFETLAALARKHFDGTLKGRLYVSAGLGGMGGAQPLAAKMLDGVALIAEVDENRIQKRLDTGYLDVAYDSIETAVNRALSAKQAGESLSIGVHCHANELLQYFITQKIIPDVLSDQTAAHDPLIGYIPDELSVHEAVSWRQKDPGDYLQRARRSIAHHVRNLLQLQKAGAHTFDYGNNIRREAFDQGVTDAFDIPGYVPAYIRDLFNQGKGPFRWAVLSGKPEEIYQLDALALQMFGDNPLLTRWFTLAQKYIHFQGLPARIAYMGLGERDAFATKVNEWVAQGVLSAPVVFGRDHHDTGSVASPYRETEAMRDGSDAIADWPILNALLNTASGAHWVSFHHGGGTGIGYALHAGAVVVADGSEDSAGRLSRVFFNDPGIGVIRHADAGYELAAQTMKAHEDRMRAPFVGPETNIPMT